MNDFILYCKHERLDEKIDLCLECYQNIKEDYYPIKNRR